MLTQDELDGLVQTAWQNMQDKGLHDGMPDTAESLLVRLTLTMTEVSEAIQEVKRHWGKPTQAEHEDKVVEELADVVLRLLDLAGCHKINLTVEKWPAPRSLDRKSVLIFLGQIGSYIGRCFSESYLFDQTVPVTGIRKEVIVDYSSQAIAMCESLATALNRDLWAAVRAKNAVNATRPYKYGTPEAAVNP